jgi:hypothetical protein
MNFIVFQSQLSKNAADIAINLSDEFVQYRWVSKDEVSTIKLTPPSTRLFTKLGYLS